jgi:MFS family permease
MKSNLDSGEGIDLVVASAKRTEIILIVLLSISSIAFFSIFPYLTLYLKQAFQISSASAGLISGSVVLISALGAWIGGIVVDSFGWLRMLRISSVLYACTFALLGCVDEYIAVVALLGCLGICRLLMEPAIKVALACADKGNGRLFRIRYLTLVGGSIVGPLVATIAYSWGRHAMFLAIFPLFILYFLVTFLFRSNQEPIGRATIPSGAVNWRVAARLVTMGFLFFFSFSQLESTLSLHLLTVDPARGYFYYRVILIINGIAAAVLCYLLERYFAFLDIYGQVLVAIVCFACGFIFLFSAQDIVWLAVGAILFTAGEVVLLPLPEIMASRIAPVQSVGRLMGLIDLRFTAFFVGPSVGGYILDTSTNLLTAVLVGCTISLCLVFVRNQGSFGTKHTAEKATV